MLLTFTPADLYALSKETVIDSRPPSKPRLL
jgi:hypothetical protein